MGNAVVGWAKNEREDDQERSLPKLKSHSLTHRSSSFTSSLRLRLQRKGPRAVTPSADPAGDHGDPFPWETEPLVPLDSADGIVCVPSFRDTHEQQQQQQLNDRSISLSGLSYGGAAFFEEHGAADANGPLRPPVWEPPEGTSMSFDAPDATSRSYSFDDARSTSLSDGAQTTRQRGGGATQLADMSGGVEAWEAMFGILNKGPPSAPRRAPAASATGLSPLPAPLLSPLLVRQPSTVASISAMELSAQTPMPVLSLSESQSLPSVSFSQNTQLPSVSGAAVKTVRRSPGGFDATTSTGQQRNLPSPPPQPLLATFVSHSPAALPTPSMGKAGVSSQQRLSPAAQSPQAVAVSHPLTMPTQLTVASSSFPNNPRRGSEGDVMAALEELERYTMSRSPYSAAAAEVVTTTKTISTLTAPKPSPPPLLPLLAASSTQRQKPRAVTAKHGAPTPTRLEPTALSSTGTTRLPSAAKTVKPITAATAAATATNGNLFAASATANASPTAQKPTGRRAGSPAPLGSLFASRVHANTYAGKGGGFTAHSSSPPLANKGRGGRSGSNSNSRSRSRSSDLNRSAAVRHGNGSSPDRRRLSNSLAMLTGEDVADGSEGNELADSVPDLRSSQRVGSIMRKNSSFRSHSASGGPADIASAAGSVSFLLGEQEAELAMTSSQLMSKAVPRRKKERLRKMSEDFGMAVMSDIEGDDDGEARVHKKNGVTVS